MAEQKKFTLTSRFSALIADEDDDEDEEETEDSMQKEQEAKQTGGSPQDRLRIE